MINFNKAIYEIIEGTTFEKDVCRTYDNISTGLNIYGIKNKKFNLGDLFGFGDYNFILVQVHHEFYYLIDINLPEKCNPINDDLFNKYLQFLGIPNNEMTLCDIYSKNYGR